MLKDHLEKHTKILKKFPVDIQVIDDKKVSLKAQGTRKANYAIMNTARSIIKKLTGRCG